MGSRASSGLLPSPKAMPAVGELAGEGHAAGVPLSSLSSHLLLSCLPFLIRVTALSPDSVQSGWSGKQEGPEGPSLLGDEDETSEWRR